MNTKMSVLALACALALAACSNKSASPAVPDAAPSTTASVPMAAPAPAASTPAEMPAATPAAAPAPAPVDGKAVVADCATEIEGNDAMQYNVSSIVVPASCTDFKITLKHTGTMPATAMGHDVVITKTSDMKAVDVDGMAAGATDGYVKPDDSRVIAHTKVIGGGETTSMSFPVSKIKDGGPYEFFCSFPGHSVLMHGSISVK